MNRFSRIRHHVNMEDVKKKRLYNITVKRIKEEEKREIEEISKKYRSNWKKELFEGMTTGSMYTQDLPSEGDTPIDIRNPVDSASYQGATGVINPGDNLGANVGTVIRDSGTGSGTNGGFNVGGQYLAFQGVGSGTNNSRFAALSPIDSSQVDTLSITAIVGNDVNGGEDPDLASEGLLVMYKTPAMANANFLSAKPDNSAGEGDSIIIPSPASHDGGLNNYSIKIPEYARAEGTQFILMQFFNSGSEFDNYGVTNINFQRRAPINVVVSLDDPAAISFISVGTNEGDPKKRKKKINDQLSSSDEYTTSAMGSQFPGQGARIDGEDPFKSTTLTSDDDIKASPIGGDEVKKAFGAPELKTALGQPTTIKQADPQAKITDIVKSGKVKPQTGQPQTSLSNFQTAAKEQKINTQVEKSVNKEIEKSSEVNNLVSKITDELKDGKVIDALKSNLDPVSKIPGVTEIKSKIADVIIDAIADVTKPILDAKTAANTLNSYDDYLGKVIKDPNTPGSTFDNPYDLKNDVTNQDLAILQKAATSKEFKSVVANLKNQLQKTNKDLSGNKNIKNLGGATDSHGIAKETAQQKLNNIISSAIKSSFALDNTLHNNVQVDIEHLLNTGNIKLTKEYTFKPGGSVADAEKTWYGKAIENVLGIPLDTMSTGKTAFVGAIAAKVGLGNADLHGGVYDAPGMYTSLEIPTETVQDGSVETELGDKGGDKGGDNLSDIIGFGGDKDQIPSVTDIDLTSDEMKSLKNLGITSDQIQQAIANGEESKINDAIEAEKFGNIKDPTDIDWSNKEEVDYFMDKYFQDKGMPQDNTWILMLLSTKVPILRVINSIGSWFNRGKVSGPKGEEGWTWKQLFDDDWLKRQVNDPKTGGWNPFRSLYIWAADKGGMLSGPTPLVREFVRRLGPMGAELLNKITDIGFEKNIKPEIEAYSDEELIKAVEKSKKENPETFNKVFDEILKKDSEYISYTNTYKKLSAITDKYPNSRNSYDVYQAYKKAGIPYWGEMNVTEDGSKWVNTYYNKGYSNSMLGKVDVLKKELDSYLTYYQYARWAKQRDPNKPGNPVNDPNFKEVTGGKKNTLYREDLNYPPFKAEIKWLADTTPGFDYGTYEKLNKEFVNTRYQVGKPNQAKSSYPTIKLMSGVTDPKNPGKFESMLKEVLKKEALMMKLSKLQVFDSEDREANKRAYEKAKKEFNDAKNDFQQSGTELVLYYRELTTAADEATKKMRDYTVKAYDRRKVEREKLQKKYEVERDKARSYYEKNVIPIRDDYNDAWKIEKEISKFNIMDIVSNVSRQYLLQTEKERIKNNWKNDSKEETMDFSIEPAQNPFANEDKPYDPFANEVKPGLGAKPGDKLALFGGKKPPNPNEKQGRGSHINIINYYQSGGMMGVKPEGWTEQDVKNYINKFYLNKQSSNTGSSDLGSVASYVGGDTTAAATVAAFNKDKRNKNNKRGSGNVTAAMVAHYKPKGTNLFERIKNKSFFDPKDIKPTFPENDPPQLDPKTGMHPNYGKQAGRYKKLDPISADSMPPTGDPETDAIVNKQKTKRTFSKIKKFMKDA